MRAVQRNLGEAQGGSESTMPSWAPAEAAATREQLRASAGATPWDIVVVGAGITGAGVARDAALRGLSVLVLEACDLAFGTSSRSTRLIHGGVRYLEQGELGLVFEALRERHRLYATAPHLVHPTRFLFPSYAHDRLAPWQLRVGLSLYDALGLFRGHLHRYLRPERALSMEPLLASDGLRGAVHYEDAITDDARLTLTVLQDARRHGARVLTYAPVRTIHVADGTRAVELCDGTRITAKTIVVAAGPWTGPQLLGNAGHELLTLSKGVHLVVRHDDVPVRQPVVVQVPQQRRVLFVVPWGTRTYLGTTDSSYEGDPGASRVIESEELEVLALVHRVLPGARLEPARIVSAWSGVRPLVRAARSARARDESTVELARTHRVLEPHLGVFAVVGGKLTTYRSMAQELVDRVCEHLGPAWPTSRPSIGPCVTAVRPLCIGTPLTPDELADPLIAALAPRHGPVARELANIARQCSDLAHPLVAGLPYRWVEVDQAIHYEGCTHLDDILRRRLPLALTDDRLGGAVARRIAERLVHARGGSQTDIELELDRYRDVITRETRRTPTF